jgi:hypothetical protein
MQVVTGEYSQFLFCWISRDGIDQPRQVIVMGEGGQSICASIYSYSICFCLLL